MGRIKEIKDTLGSAIEKGKDLVVGGSRQIADVFGNRDVVEQYQADIQVQTGYGSTKDILKTIDIFLNNECVNEGDKVKLLDEVIRKTSSTCVKYRALFYRASLLIKIAESCEEPAYLYVSAIEHLYQAIGEFFQENSESPDNPSVAQKWGRSISDAFKALEKGFAEEIHSATLGWLGSDAGDPKGELAKSFKEFPASKRLDRIDVNEQNCISFSQYLIACSYEKINQIDDARRWFIRSCSSKSPAIQLQAKVEYPVFVPKYIDKVVEKEEPYEVKVPFPVDKVIEKRIEVPKIKEVKVEVKVPVYHDKIVEVKVHYKKEVPEYIAKIVEKKVPVRNEVPVYIDKVVEKKTYVPVQPKEKIIYQLQTRIVPIKIPQNVDSLQEYENYLRNSNLSPLSEKNQLQYEQQNNNKDTYNIFQSKNEKEKTYIYEQCIKNAVQEPFSSNIVKVQQIKQADK